MPTLEIIIDTTAATVIVVRTTFSNTPARTVSVHRIRLNSEIWFMSMPSMNAVWLLTPAAYPSAANRGMVATTVKSAKKRPIGSASSMGWPSSSDRPSEMKKIATPRVLIGSIFVSMCILYGNWERDTPARKAVISPEKPAVTPIAARPVAYPRAPRYKSSRERANMAKSRLRTSLSRRKQMAMAAKSFPNRMRTGPAMLPPSSPSCGRPPRTAMPSTEAASCKTRVPRQSCPCSVPMLFVSFK
mmetsp:Transcript_27581/g.62769  ORF Transcript_27581/g.62769 Transcript_27581/m.62769 type:complete len:244 (-) Transcript_27581:928-1659(-)